MKRSIALKVGEVNQSIVKRQEDTSTGKTGSTSSDSQVHRGVALLVDHVGQAGQQREEVVEGRLLAKPGKVVRHVPPFIVHLCKSSRTFIQDELIILRVLVSI